MAFIQIIELTTNDPEKLTEINNEWVQATAGKRTARRQIVAQDRRDPARYLEIVFFDSYESAMGNSNLPETKAFAERFHQVAKDVTYNDLDVVLDREL